MAFLQGGGEPVGEPVFLAQVEEPGVEQEEAAGEHGATGEEEHGVLAEVFHWMNFILIAVGVWYLAKKIGGPLFAERTRAIQEHMLASARAMKEASKRLDGIEQKLRFLDEEIRDIRLTAQREAAAEQARMEELAQTEAGKIAQAAEQEIETAAKAARRELQKYSAELAIGLAEKRIRETISPDAEKRILRSFVSDLGDGGGRS